MAGWVAIGLQRVIEVVPLLPKDTPVQIEEFVPEPLLIFFYLLLQRTLALAGEEAHQRCRVDRNIVRNYTGAQTEWLK